MLTITGYSTPKYSTSFKSYSEREGTLISLRQLELDRARMRAQLERARKEALERTRQELERAKQAAAEKERQEAEARANAERLEANRKRILEEIKQEIMKYPEPDDAISVKMAKFLSGFTCAIQNNSEHDVREFFGDEETAKELREKLSPECQHDSLELREEIQKIDEAKDPVMMLIAANNMKRFMPKEGILNQEQQENLLQGMKDIVIMAIKNGDMSNFDEDEKLAIGEMVQMIKAADSVNFGISVKLKALIDKLNRKKLNLGFIPPVQVRELGTQVKQSVKL